MNNAENHGQGHNEINSQKNELRQIMLARRRSMAPEEAAAKSGAICRRLEELLRQALGGAAKPLVLSYLAYGREVNLAALHRKLWELGWRVAVPLTGGLAPGLMEAAAYTPETELCRTALGVLEPVGAAVYPPEAIDAVILPGVAFDQGCGRLGHGGGYYDRLLPRLRAGALLVGAAYDWQVLEVGEVPRESWDRSCDLLATERRLLGESKPEK